VRTAPLHANVVQAARSRAADAINGIVTRWKDGQNASLLTVTTDVLDDDNCSATFPETPRLLQLAMDAFTQSTSFPVRTVVR
jgi:hypothetical protein